MRIHRDHILTSELRQVYDYLFDMGEADDSFDVSENKPAGKNRKKAVAYHYAGKRSYPFSFIVNSGERKDYHLFYIRSPGKGDLDVVREYFGDEKILVNGAGEITVRLHNPRDATNMWKIVKTVQLQ
jgi:hypothetical protein